MEVDIKTVRPNIRFLLRQVNPHTLEFKQLKDAIRINGFGGALLCRPQTDVDGTKFLEIVDGHMRHAACLQLGYKTINVDVKEISDEEILKVQLMYNLHRVPTTPYQFANQLRRMLTHNSDLTIVDLAAEIGYSTSWVSQRLNLAKIKDPEIQALVDTGKIKATNAVKLSQLPEELHKSFVDAAITETVEEFAHRVTPIIRAETDRKKHGKDSKPTEFTPKAHLRKIKEIKAAMEDASFAKAYASSATTKAKAFQAALRWALHLDPESLEAQKQKFDEQAAYLKKISKSRPARKKKDLVGP